jgi:hypothetical protein
LRPVGFFVDNFVDTGLPDGAQAREIKGLPLPHRKSA